MDLLIVGDGFSATAALHWLTELGATDLRVGVIGSACRLGPGHAYGCASPAFRVNVPDRHMTILPDCSDDFPDWACLNTLDRCAETARGDLYHQRRDYGRYLTEKASAASARFVHFERHHGQVIDIHQRRQGLQALLDDGRVAVAPRMLLATGNAAPIWPCPVPVMLQARGRLIENPWIGDWVGDINSKSRVVLVGSGLTMMDCATALHLSGHRSRMMAISGRGRLPAPQGEWGDRRWPVEPPTVSTALALLIAARRHIGQRCATGDCWQDGYEDFRNSFQESWRNLPICERHKLAVRLRPIWNAIRFRPPPQAEASVERLRQSGQLTTHIGRAVRILRQSDCFLVETDRGASWIADAVINCSGPGPDRLARRLVAQGLCRADMLRHWLDVSPDLEVLGPNGSPVPGLFAIGPQTVASQGDVVGTAAIARQAIRFAKRYRARGERRSSLHPSFEVLQ